MLDCVKLLFEFKRFWECGNCSLMLGTCFFAIKEFKQSSVMFQQACEAYENCGAYLEADSLRNSCRIFARKTNIPREWDWCLLSSKYAKRLENEEILVATPYYFLVGAVGIGDPDLTVIRYITSKNGLDECVTLLERDSVRKRVHGELRWSNQNFQPQFYPNESTEFQEHAFWIHRVFPLAGEDKNFEHSPKRFGIIGENRFILQATKGGLNALISATSVEIISDHDPNNLLDVPFGWEQPEDDNSAIPVPPSFPPPPPPFPIYGQEDDSFVIRPPPGPPPPLIEKKSSSLLSQSEELPSMIYPPAHPIFTVEDEKQKHIITEDPNLGRLSETERRKLEHRKKKQQREQLQQQDEETIELSQDFPQEQNQVKEPEQHTKQEHQERLLRKQEHERLLREQEQERLEDERLIREQERLEHERLMQQANEKKRLIQERLQREQEKQDQQKKLLEEEQDRYRRLRQQQIDESRRKQQQEEQTDAAAYLQSVPSSREFQTDEQDDTKQLERKTSVDSIEESKSYPRNPNTSAEVDDGGLLFLRRRVNHSSPPPRRVVLMDAGDIDEVLAAQAAKARKKITLIDKPGRLNRKIRLEHEDEDIDLPLEQKHHVSMQGASDKKSNEEQRDISTSPSPAPPPLTPPPKDSYHQEEQMKHDEGEFSEDYEEVDQLPPHSASRAFFNVGGFRVTTEEAALVNKFLSSGEGWIAARLEDKNRIATSVKCTLEGRKIEIFSEPAFDLLETIPLSEHLKVDCIGGDNGDEEFAGNNKKNRRLVELIDPNRKANGLPPLVFYCERPELFCAMIGAFRDALTK